VKGERIKEKRLNRKLVDWGEEREVVKESRCKI